MERPATSGLRRRDAALDGLRTIAVLLMIASHTTRLIVWDSRREWSRFSLLIEPLTASLFLILVGASLVHSWRISGSENRTAWYRKHALRALGLWAVSCLFYTLEDGFQLPDAVLMSGILATIAYSILIGMVLVSLRRPVPTLLGISAGLAYVHFHLDRSHIQWFMVNAGNSPPIPLFLFACLGALGIMALESQHRWIRITLVACAILTLSLVLHLHPFGEVFTKPLGRFETVRALVSGPAEARIEKIIPYYNLRPILVPVIASLTILMYAVFAIARPLWDKFARYAFPMGRHSLDVYILHLALLALLVVKGGMRPLKQTWQGDVVFAGVVMISYAWALGHDFLRARRKSAPVTT